jgi:hypothetical protein
LEAPGKAPDSSTTGPRRARTATNATIRRAINALAHLYRALGFEPVARFAGYCQEREDAIQPQRLLA